MASVALPAGPVGWVSGSVIFSCSMIEPGHPCVTTRPLEPIEQRCAQLMQADVVQLHLGLHPDGADDMQIGCRIDEVLEQSRLADAGLASQEQRSAFAPSNIRDHAIEHGTLPATPARIGGVLGLSAFEPSRRSAERSLQVGGGIPRHGTSRVTWGQRDQARPSAEIRSNSNRSTIVTAMPRS